jgi:hypothetical protein
MGHLRDLGWHGRIRIKANFWSHPTHLSPLQGGDVELKSGHRSFWHGVAMTDTHFGPVHLAGARPRGSEEAWDVSRDEAAELKTFAEYGLRFDLAENFLDDTSTGLQWEDAWSRSAAALERLCCVLAITPLSLVSVGTSVVQQGKRRRGDPHGFRGASSLKIGWQWVPYALTQCYELLTTVSLSSAPAPEPAMASKKQEARRRQSRFVFENQEAA